MSRLIVPDQTPTLIARPDRYEPSVNRLVEEMCDHYGVAVLPARPAHPRDKALTSCCTLFGRLSAYFANMTDRFGPS